MKVNLTKEMLQKIQNEVFGPCTVVNEAMSLEELSNDLLTYLDEQKVYFKGEKKAVYKPSLTLTTLKSWLLLRVEVEEMDAYPEHPFDKTDDQIASEIAGKKALNNRLKTNINKFIDDMRKEQNAK